MLPVCRCSLSALTTGKAMETELKASQHPLDKFAYCPVCGSRRFDVATVKSKRCADCGFELFMNPSASVAVFIRNGEGELLFVVRGCEPAKGTLDLPGGFTDIGETVEEAVRREVMEETGLQVASMHYLFSLPNKYLYSGLLIPTMDLFFECRVDDLSGLRANDDAAACRWLKPSEVKACEIGLDSIRRGTMRYVGELL